METQGTISAVQKVLATYRFSKPTSFSEEFAVNRFHKKFEIPDHSKVNFLIEKCWEDFINYDQTLPNQIILPPGKWYLARMKLHSLLRGDPLTADISFPNGSSVVPTFGHNSVELWLKKNVWTCTVDAFDDFVILAYRHRALRVSVRKRFKTYLQNNLSFFSVDTFYKMLWDRFNKPNLSRKQVKFLCFKFQVSRLVVMVRGSRFATVPKNNEKRRPINIEPFCNILLQRQIGNFIRSRLKVVMNHDLDTVADKHRKLISNLKYATIDLRNASDSVSVALCKFLLPQKFFERLMRLRSPMLFGLDNQYHVPKKISSMGNGFTFELMTAILLCISRELDKSATVFGDDIIIETSKASELTELITSVGFIVNAEKSFIDGPFRESCGANYHEYEGYIESYDFRYPETLADCALILEKARRLRSKYPSFASLYTILSRIIPTAMRGGPFGPAIGPAWSPPTIDIRFPCNFDELPRCRCKEVTDYAKQIQYSSDVREAVELVWIPKVDSPAKNKLKSKEWAKYYSYLASGLVSKSVVSEKGRWCFQRVYYLKEINTKDSFLILRDIPNGTFEPLG